MQFFLKLAISIAVIIGCTQIGKRLPALAGLIATMPLTTLIVMVWLYTDTNGSPDVMAEYTRGVVWGIVPTMLFFVVALFCFRQQMSLAVVLSASFGAWLAGALMHQWLLR
jgi:uncharacterized membrane protein (GlpM family)